MSILKGIIAVIFIATLFVGCAKEKDYQTVHIKDKRLHHPKSLIANICTQKDPCIYVPSVANTPYNVSASRAYWQGEEKLVIGQITEDKLQFLQVEEDERFTENVNNLSPVLKFGIKHLDFKCKEDAFGDCTNAQELDSKKPWDKRKFVEINLDGFKVQEKNSLPIEFGELFKAGCYSATDQEVSSVKIEKDAINLTIKKTYNSSLKCSDVEEMSDLRYLTFTVDYKYSLIKLSSLTDKNYPVVDYPVFDQNTFGFFKNENKFKTVDNHENVIGVRKHLMNRWSPNKKILTYYLNAPFYKPENKRILDATKVGIETINSSLRKANANFRIVLENGSDKDVGDLRNNFIIFVNDPQSSGVIGYGPSVSNPRTGEILNARTVMYYGTIKKFVSSAYDDLVETVIAEYVKNTQKKVIPKAPPIENVKSLKVPSLNTYLQKNIHLFENYVESRFDEIDFSKDLERLVESSFSEPEASEDQQFEFKDLLKRNHEENSLMEKLAQETFFHASYVNYESAVREALLATLKEGETPPFWADLTEAQRERIIERLLPYVWVPTLVHEFGHNLGLRHNFHGTNDKNNFYNAQERASLNIKRETVSASVMDYQYRNSNELPIMGKYDIAALRFAYNREVLDESGNVHKVLTTLNDLVDPRTTKAPIKLKQYKYCTDENVNSNTLCNRFDEGQTYEEVADHYINKIKESYDKINFRGRRYSFSSKSGDYSYLNYLLNSYLKLKSFFDIYDQEVFNGSYKDTDWQTNKRLVSIKNASDNVFNFLMDTLEMPAYHCIEVDTATATPTKISPFALITDGTKLDSIKFDVRYGCRFLNINDNGKTGMVYFEFGTYFNNALDFLVNRDDIVQNDNSQIDVRGIWIDKAMASFILTLRSVSSSHTIESSKGNFIDHKEYKDRFMKFIDGLLLDRFEKEIMLSPPEGAPIKVKVAYTFENNHKVNRSHNYFVNGFFGLKNSRNNFSEIMFKLIRSNLEERKNSDDLVLRTHADALTVYELDPKKDVSKYNFDEIVEFKTDGEVDYRFGLYSKNTKGLELAYYKFIADTLDEFSEQQIKEAIDLIDGKFLAPIMPPDTAIELAKLSKPVLETYLSGALNQKQLLKAFKMLFEVDLKQKTSL